MIESNEHLLEWFRLAIQNCLREQLPINIFASDKNGYVIDGNTRMIETLKETRETFIGAHLSKWGEENWANCKRVIETGLECRAEEIGIDNRVYLTVRKPVFGKNDTTILGITGISLDITEEKQAEISKKILLENARHDIYTPLSGIIGCAQLIQSAHDLEKQKEYANYIILSSRGLLDFQNKLFEAIQVADGTNTFVRKKFDLKKGMELVVDMNQSAAIKKNLTLTLNYDKTIYPYLIGDPDRVQRIVLELITNALKFTEKGKVALSVQLIRRSSKESIIEIVVSDTGIGIPKDQQEKIFHRFNRLIPSSKGIYKGAGLGLSIVKQFVDDLKGEIFVNSKEGEGTTLGCIISFQNPLIMDSSGVQESAPLPFDYLE